MNPAEWFDLVEQRAPRLRAAGVMSMSIDGCSIQLAAAIHESPVATPTAQDPEPVDPRDNLPGYTFDPSSKT